LCAGDTGEWFVCLNAGRSSLPDPLGKARSAVVRREASPYMSPRHLSPGDISSPAHRQPGATLVQLDITGLPAELHGVSVKELVKALGLSVCLSVCLSHSAAC